MASDSQQPDSHQLYQWAIIWNHKHDSTITYRDREEDARKYYAEAHEFQNQSGWIGVESIELRRLPINNWETVETHTREDG
jgi:hypothetical protein